MAGTRLLFFGRNPAMMALIDKELSAAGLEATGFLEEELLVAELQKGEVKLLIIGGGVEDEPRARLLKICADAGIQVHEHFAGPTALVDSVTNALR